MLASTAAANEVDSRSLASARLDQARQDWFAPTESAYEATTAPLVSGGQATGEDDAERLTDDRRDETLRTRTEREP